MISRELGRTGLKVSQLGLGAMRLPMIGVRENAVVDRSLAIPLIHRAFKAGISYVDTAVGYCNSDSQRALGDALKGWRDKVVISTKNCYFGTVESEWWKNLEDSLERLQVESIDLYNHHGVNGRRFAEEISPRISRWMHKAKDRGLVKHIGVSFHDDNTALRTIVDSGYAEVITLQYNLLDRKLEDGIAYAHSKGIGVVVMGPLGGGRLALGGERPEPDLGGAGSVPQLALRFVLNNPYITVALSGMSSIDQVVENVVATGDFISLSAEERTAIQLRFERVSRMAGLYCTGCRYCQPCVSGVDIPAVFDHYNLSRVYGLHRAAMNGYEMIVSQKRGADGCVECAICEEKCPQHLPIRAKLQEAHSVLAVVGLAG